MTHATEGLKAFLPAQFFTKLYLLAHGGENFYDGWMKDPKSAMISCNDGFRPVSFLLETMNEEAEAERD